MPGLTEPKTIMNLSGNHDLVKSDSTQIADAVGGAFRPYDFIEEPKPEPDVHIRITARSVIRWIGNYTGVADFIVPPSDPILTWTILDEMYIQFGQAPRLLRLVPAPEGHAVHYDLVEVL